MVGIKERIVQTNRKFNKIHILILTAISIITIYIVFTYEIVYIDGKSMEPTLHNHDILIVNRLKPKFGIVKLGDIIVFPHNDIDSKNYIKRVVGVPGDEVDIIDNKLYINDIHLDEPYIYEEMKNMGDIQFPVTVPQNYYFVMGDNRNHSSDSRYSDVGMVSIRHIVGKAQLRIWPLSDIIYFK